MFLIMELCMVSTKQRNEDVLKKKLTDLKSQVNLMSEDIRKIRNQIDKVSKSCVEAEKKFDKAEQAYLEAKEELFIKAEEKDKLMETLKIIIQKTEYEKAQKISSLVGKLEIKSKINAINKEISTTDINSNENMPKEDR